MDQLTPKSFFDNFHPKTAFAMGFVTAILVLGTTGFVVLGGCLLSDGCDVGGLGGSSVANANAPSPIVPSVPAADPEAAPSGPIPAVSQADHIRGDINAPVLIIEYSDYQCPFCERFHPTMLQVMKEYEGKVSWIYRHFPLSFHPEAEPAAEAAECAGEQGKFWEYSDKLFENQASLGTAFYPKLAGDLGLNTGDFQKCLDSDKYLDVIRKQAQDGGTAGVTGTPGSFVIDKDGNATPIRGALPYASVKQMIDAALQ